MRRSSDAWTVRQPAGVRLTGGIDLGGADACRDSKYANHFKIPAVDKALQSGHGMRFQLEWSPTPGKAPEMQTVTYAPPTYIGCVVLPPSLPCTGTAAW